jgi:hypothetical protein
MSPTYYVTTENKITVTIDYWITMNGIPQIFLSKNVPAITW